MIIELRTCPDGGACHHDCTGPCWRVRYCAPFTSYGDEWGPYPHLLEAVQAQLKALDPDHDWEVTCGMAADNHTPTLRLDRTGPERQHPMINLGLPDPDAVVFTDYNLARVWAPMVAAYAAETGRALDDCADRALG